MTSILLAVKIPLLALLTSLVSLVNPFVGTDFHGHTFPGAAYPFGMVQLSPDTRPDSGNWDGCSGYHYSDSLIYGFSHTHLSGTGCDDLCDIMVMPVRGFDAPAGRKDYASAFSHASEKASPGYYEVKLERYDVTAKLSAGRRAGFHEYIFAPGSAPQIVIDLKHRDQVLDAELHTSGRRVVTGHRRSRSWATDQSVYFYAEFSEPFERSLTDTGGTAALLTFSRRCRKVEVKVGLSSVSVENAKMNLDAEAGTDFDSCLKDCVNAWESFLSKLAPPAGFPSPEVFYTALYHCAIHPSLYSDANGEYRGMDRQVHRALRSDGTPYEHYTIFSLWDTFRGLHPLLCELEPERTADFINSFISIYREAGKLPVWELWGNETNCMIGYNAAPVIADAAARGLGGFDLEEAFEAMLASSRNGEFGLDSFRRNGLVLADDEHESVSKTLEYAYDDWCVAQVAKMLGRDEEYEEYMRSAQYWRNVFDPQTGFMRARLNGRFVTPFHPTEVNNHYTEANSWQYSFFVPHDLVGLMEAHGGREAFLTRIDSLFRAPEKTSGRTQADITGQIGQYAHGNEPSHHIAWIPELLGRPDLSRELVQRILTTLYSNDPDGLCGNDDCGQMSAWYVLSALGRYPVCPGAGLKTLTSMPKTIVVNPVFEMDNDIILDSMRVSIGNIEPGAKAYYSIDGGTVHEYSDPLVVSEPCTIEAYCVAADGRRSFTTRTSLRKVRRDMKIELGQRYNPQYSGGGDEALIDGFRGSTNWRTGGWQGYQGRDFTAVVDLLSIRHIGELSAGFCQDARSWIWMPRSVEFYSSLDGKEYSYEGSVESGVDPQDYEIQIHELGLRLDKEARYVKIIARQLGTIPDWHPGAGGQSFIFIDEISVKD